MVEYFGPRDLVLDGQSVSGDTDQSSTDLTNVNEEGNTQTLRDFLMLLIFVEFFKLFFHFFIFHIFTCVSFHF